MTTNVLLVTAEAVRKAIEGMTLSQKFTVSRNYGDWEDLLEDNVKDLRIDVVPQSCESSLFDRAKTEYRIRVSVLLRKRIQAQDRRAGKIENSVIDQLVGDLQAVHEYFVPSQPTQTGLRLTDVQQARWLEGTVKAPFSRALLKVGQYSGWNDIVFGFAKAAGA